MKSAATVILLLFVAVSVVYLIAGEARAPSSVEPPVAVRSDAQPPQPTADAGESGSGTKNARHARTIAYYFHGTMRCPTCLTMERYAREAIEESFAAEIEAGAVEWQSVDYDEPANGHFAQEYGLSASALVLVAVGEGIAPSWRGLDRIWDLSGDEDAFKAYVVAAVRSMRRGES